MDLLFEWVVTGSGGTGKGLWFLTSPAETAHTTVLYLCTRCKGAMKCTKHACLVYKDMFKNHTCDACEVYFNTLFLH